MAFSLHLEGDSIEAKVDAIAYLFVLAGVELLQFLKRKE
jgi:hypothetical protein